MKGVTVWFTGLSGAGKTTIAERLTTLLHERGVRAERLDGDVVRQSLTRDLGFSKEDRDKNIERVTFVAKLLTRNGVIVLAAFISPYRAAREHSRQEIGEFLEVYVKASLDTLIQRDVKGLYRKALAGEIQNFTGVNDPYEAPEQPDLICDTDVEDVEQSTTKVLQLLAERGYLPESAPAGAGNGWYGAAAGNGPLLPESPATPHGGVLIERELQGEARTAALARAERLIHVELDERALADAEMIGVGALSPLTGFMGRAAYDSVLTEMRLPGGLLWSLPVTLAVAAPVAERIDIGQEIALTGPGAQVIALMQVTEKYTYDKQKEATLAFGTADPAHPGVAGLYRQGEVLLGGPIQIVNRPGGDQFQEYRLTPRELRTIFANRGWRSVVAFQTRNPVHRAHEYLQKCALEIVDGLLLHPLVGATKADDTPAGIRMTAYEAILHHYYPPDRVQLAVFPAAMRYAGPREAIFHAICRKNYGCTHFIVGRDHAGVGTDHGTNEAQELNSRFSPA